MPLNDAVAGDDVPLTEDEEIAGWSLGTIILGIMSTLEEENAAVADILAWLLPETPLIESVPRLSAGDFERLLNHFAPHIEAFSKAKN
jgi:hypothetical protein